MHRMQNEEEEKQEVLNNVGFVGIINSEPAGWRSKLNKMILIGFSLKPE